MLWMRVVADDKQVEGLIQGLSERIGGDVSGAAGGWAIVGVRSRGDEIARRLAAQLKPDYFGILDITLYRDDLSEIGAQAIVGTTEIDFSVDGMTIVLVDDVLMSGRSIRAALQSLLDLGRPKRVWLSVLVDRGGRELPIAADHVGLDLSTELGEGEWVEVQVKPTDACDAVVVHGRSKTEEKMDVKTEASKH